jgi:hypothetical protein
MQGHHATIVLEKQFKLCPIEYHIETNLQVWQKISSHHIVIGEINIHG